MTERLEDNPIVQDIRKRLAQFTQKEPYITNAAISIYLDLIRHDSHHLTDLDAIKKSEYNRGYANGYATGKKSKSTPSPQPVEGENRK